MSDFNAVMLELKDLQQRVAVLEAARIDDAARVSVRDVIEWIAGETGVSAAVICAPGRDFPVARVRFAVSWGARKVTRASLPRIARELGRRDHSTIHHALRRAEALRSEDRDFRDLTDRLVAAFTDRDGQ